MEESKSEPNLEFENETRPKKYYVVWVGRQTGIFESWEDCNEQVSGFSKALYKSFPSRKSAEKAFKNPKFVNPPKEIIKQELPVEVLPIIGDPIMDSISVDGSWNTATGMVEYQGVYTESKELIFRVGPLQDGTNNIVEFLAIVHALAYCKQNKIDLPIYSDSKNAINWVRKKEARTNHPKSDKNAKLFELIERAIKWLNENTYENKILKWKTYAWGENPADFGRK